MLWTNAQMTCSESMNNVMCTVYCGSIIQAETDFKAK